MTRLVGSLRTRCHGSHNREVAMNDEGKRIVDKAWGPALAVALLVAGIAWLVVFYLSHGLYPVYSWRYWNLVVGFGAIAAALGILARWR